MIFGQNIASLRGMAVLVIQSTLSKTDTFGTCTKCTSQRGVRLIESQIKRVYKERQGPTLSVRFTEVSVKRESTVNLGDGRETARRLGREQREGF